MNWKWNFTWICWVSTCIAALCQCMSVDKDKNKHTSSVLSLRSSWSHYSECHPWTLKRWIISANYFCKHLSNFCLSSFLWQPGLLQAKAYCCISNMKRSSLSCIVLFKSLGCVTCSVIREACNELGKGRTQKQCWAFALKANQLGTSEPS